MSLLDMELEMEPNQMERRDFFNSVDSYDGGGAMHFSKPGMRLTEEYRLQIKGFFHNEPCIYNHRIYDHATVIYNAMRNLLGGVKQEPSTARRRKKKDETTTSSSVEAQDSTTAAAAAADFEVPKNEFSSANEKRLSFSLVFQTLKYQKFLNEMLTNSKFFEINPKLEDQFSCVMVVLCDYQTRKFQRRKTPPGDETIAQMAQIEDALEKCKTKLNAALARSRISARVESLDSLLPDIVRKNERIGSCMNIGCWINNLKSSFPAMQEELSKNGFCLVESEDELQGKTFLRDRHCSDVIFFPHHLIDYLEALPVVKRKALIIQDKSSSLGVHSIRWLMSDGDDVMHVNVGSGMTTVHLVSLIHLEEISGSVFAFGIDSDNQLKQVLRNIDKFGAKGRVQVVNEKFLDVDLDDSRFKDIKVILITANCTRCGVPNPVNFIVSEGEDYDFTSYASILRDLSFGHVDTEKVTELISQNMATLKHALQFPRVQTVVFCTRSLNESENESVVNASIDYINTVEQTKSPFRLSPPLLPFSDVEIETEVPLSGKFIKFPPSLITSGCFVATISREADDPKEAAKDILARAAARGIIWGIPGGGGAETIPPPSKPKPKQKKEKPVHVTKGVKPSKGDAASVAPDADQTSPPPPPPSTTMA